MKKILTDLKIPFNKNFYNLPVEHYETLQENIGHGKVTKTLLELLAHCKNDEKLSSKVKFLLEKLNGKDDTECVCGFKLLGQEYPECPVCGLKFYKDKKCYYLDVDMCTLDGQKCDVISKVECKKLKG